MKLTVKTSTLREMVTKVIKASTNNKMIPLTSLLSIVLENNTLSLTASDAINFFTVSTDNITGESFSVVVKVDLFSKIVSKTTSDTITLELIGNSLAFTGNGHYKIDLPLNEDGQLIKFPVVDFNANDAETGTIKLSNIKSIILANKPSLAVTHEAPHLTCYYCGTDSVISADSYNICCNYVKTFNTPALISPIVFDLLGMFDVEDIEYKFYNNIILFTSPKMKLYAKTMPDIDKYPIDVITQMAKDDFPSKCTLPKTALVNILDRLSLFITDFDINGVYLTFTAEGLRITSTNNAASELIPYQDSTNFAPFTCCAGVDSLRKQIMARTGEVVKLEYGADKSVKLVDNNVTQIVALLETNDTTETTEEEE